MATEHIFQIHLALGYIAWGLAFGAYILPKFRAMPRVEVHRAIATLHGFRFFGLVFLIPGVTGPHLALLFTWDTAWGDFIIGVLALMALITVRVRPLFWLFVVVFNVLGIADLILAYVHAMETGVPEHAGDLGATYVIPVLYVPILMITHLTALYWLLRREPRGLAASE